MSWFVVGGIAIGATAGAIVGSKKGGDDVWKDALIGGAIGGTAGYGAGAIGAAEAAAPAAIAGEGGAGILGAEAVAGGSGLALGGAGLETGGAMAGGAGIAGGATPAATMVAPEAGAGILGGGAAPAAIPGGAGGFGGYGGATVGSTGGFAPGMQAPIQMVSAPEAAFGSSSLPTGATALPGGEAFGGSGGATVGETGGAYNLGGAPTQSPLEKGFGSAMSWLSEPKNAMLTGVLGLGALSMFNNNNENDFGDSNVTPAGYPLSPNFKPSRYQPTRQYASGGITDAGAQNKIFPQSQIPDRTQFAVPTQMPASMEVLRSDYDSTINPYTGDEARFAKGGDTSKYQAMIDPRMNVKEERAPSWVGRSVADVNDPKIYVDKDEDTAYQDALTAAQTRMGKAAKGANVQLAAMQKPKPLGGINLGPVAGVEEHKATGGIASLGGYAHGGNPHLLRGPGDGMSDDIPATIADKQPARLADGEFVVPADVVSGLGNGSTEAGAKKLHQMMDKVRVDRTGTKKQGKQINADKYVPGAKAEKKAAGGIASYAAGNLVVNPETNEVGYWTGQNEWGMGGTWNPVTQEQYNQVSTPVAPTANTTAQGYNPDYYNRPYWQNQLSGAQQAFDQQNALKAFDPAYYLAQNPDLAADRHWSQNPFQHYQEYGIKEGRSPYEGGQAGVQLQDPAALAAAQTKLTDVQSNLSRLENTPIQYNPYTIANRPSAAEPQFYGNIYRGSTPDYATPGYTLGGNLGQWNNVAGEDRRAIQPMSRAQEVTQAYLQNLGRAPEREGFNYWMQSGLSGPELNQGFQQSPEATAVARGNINRMYQDILGTQADAAGLENWRGLAQNTGTGLGRGLQDVRVGLQNAAPTQAQTDYVTQAYQDILGRAPDQAGFKNWTAAMSQGMTQDQLAAAIRSSEEAKARAAQPKPEEKKARKGGILAAKK